MTIVYILCVNVSIINYSNLTNSYSSEFLKIGLFGGLKKETLTTLHIANLTLKLTIVYTTYLF